MKNKINLPIEKYLESLKQEYLKNSLSTRSNNQEAEETIEKGTEVLILSIDGVKAVVTTNLQAKVPEEIFEGNK